MALHIEKACDRFGLISHPHHHCAGLQSQDKTVISNALHYPPNLFSHSIVHPENNRFLVRIPNYCTRMCSLCVNEPCNLAGWPADMSERRSDWHC